MNVLNHEEEYRGKDLIEKISNSNIIVCGCGAVGSNFIDSAIRQGFKNIRVVDMDRVEDHNRATQVWDRRCVGQFKVAAMKMLAQNSMGLQLDVIPKKLEEKNINKIMSFGDSPIVVEGFDNAESRSLVRKYCLDNFMDCLHIGLAQNFAEVTWNEDYVILEQKGGVDVCDYPLARNTAMLAVTVGIESLIHYIEKKEKNSYSITLRDLRITSHSLR